MIADEEDDLSLHRTRRLVLKEIEYIDAVDYFFHCKQIRNYLQLKRT